MFLYLNSGIYITSHDSWELICLSIENIVMGIGDSLLDWNLDNLLLLFDSFALACFAFVLLFHDLTSTFTFLTLDLSLSHDSWSYLYHFDCYSNSFAFLTFDRIASSFSLTIWTDSISCYCYFLHCPVIDIFKSNLNWN